MEKIDLSSSLARVGAVLLAGTAMLCSTFSATAATWSDTYIGYRYGTTFAEPFNNQDIKKNIFNLGHVSGYKYGTNFFNVDFLMSDSKDPSDFNSKDGAQEAYVVYRHTLSLSSVTGGNMKFSVVRDLGFTAGFDWNNKNDAGYNSKKRMLVAGPTVMMDVPGFLNVSVLALWESNAPCTSFPPPSCVSRYTYKTHPMLTAAWGIPFGDSPFSFEGFFNYIAAKGKNEFGGGTKPETNFDGQIMLDVGRVLGGPKKTFKVGLEYQYWKNKFGNDSSGPAGDGAIAKTPMIRVEYHF